MNYMNAKKNYKKNGRSKRKIYIIIRNMLSSNNSEKRSVSAVDSLEVKKLRIDY